MVDPKKPPGSGTTIQIHEFGIQGPAFQAHFNEPEGGRNALCPCGSGRKYKKCHGHPDGPIHGQKPPQQKLTFKFSQPLQLRVDGSEPLIVKLDPWSKTAEVVSHGVSVAPSVVEIERNYARPKGVKVTATARIDGSAPHFDFFRALSSYSLCFGVDTNSKMVGGQQISVTATTNFDPFQDLSKTYYIYPGIAYEVRGAKLSPEKIGWLLFIHNFMASTSFDFEKRYCLVVDSHLDEIPAINRREKPVLDEHFLPPQFDLLYASTDSGNEIQNLLIKRADWVANQLFDLISTGSASVNMFPSPNTQWEVQGVWDVPTLVSNGTLKLT